MSDTWEQRWQAEADLERWAASLYEPVRAFVDKVLTAEYDRLESDVGAAIALQDFDELDRLTVVAYDGSLRHHHHSVSDLVGYVASRLDL